jgi:hypothetical protein
MTLHPRESRYGPREFIERVLRAAEEHIECDHPELVGKITREDLLAMSETARLRGCRRSAVAPRRGRRECRLVLAPLA